MTPEFSRSCAPSLVVTRLATDFAHPLSGVIVWVIYAQTEPFLGMTGDDVLDSIKDDPANARHEIPGWTDAVARDIIVRCWALKGGARPTFSDARDVLTAHYCGSEVGGDPAEVYGQH